MKNNKTAIWWQVLLYLSAVLVLIVTITCIWLDKDNISAYYEEKQNERVSSSLSLSSVFEGSGTEGSPYRITSANDLFVLGQMIVEGASTKGVYFIQTNDIDLKQHSWMPLGTADNPFQGVYDGNGKQIRNLILEQDNHAFMGVLTGEIRNVHFMNTRIDANQCAVAASHSDGANGRIVNCIISNVTVCHDDSEAASVINNITGCSVLGLVIQNVPNDLSFFQQTDGICYIFECTYEGKNIGTREGLQQKNNINWEYVTADLFTRMGQGIEILDNYGIRGTYNALSSDEGTLSFSDDRIYLYNEDRMDDLEIFWKEIAFYCVLFLIAVLAAVGSSKFFHWDLSKCVFYFLMIIFAAVLLIFGFTSRGEWVLSMLYDGTSKGELKYFTDFSDILIPGSDPYTRVKTHYTSIYPPLISAIMAVLQRFIPSEYMVDSMTIRNSQMGSMIYLFWTVFWMIMMYEVVLVYKKGQKAEKVLFFGAICSSYPMIHCLERGNVVFIVGILIAVYLYNYRAKSFWLRQLAFFSLSVAAGIKIYPAILGVLLIKEGRIKDVVNCLAMGIVVNLLPSVVFSTGFSSIAYMFINALAYVEGNTFIGGKIDLSHLLQIPREVFRVSAEADPMQYYSQIIVGILLLSTIIVLWSRMEDWKIYMLCILDLILLASFSPYYYILYTIAPLMMFLDSNPKKNTFSVVYAVLFSGILMTFVSCTKYPVAVYAPTQSVWHMTLVTGFFLIIFEIVLLADGIIHFINRLVQFVRKCHA